MQQKELSDNIKYFSDNLVRYIKILKDDFDLNGFKY